jgi:hypothetical protein
MDRSMMNRQGGREAIIIRGVLEGGGRLEWRPRESDTIYVGSDPACQWHVTAADVAPYHWHLCWYGSRLWMADLETGPDGSPPVRGSYQWKMAPIGAVLRIGGTVLVFEIGAPEAHGRAMPPGRASPDDPTLILNAAAAPPDFIDDRDPDATQLVAPDDLRALAPFGPRSSGQHRAMAPSAEPRRSGEPALEEMFIVPAQQPLPPPKGPGPLARITAVVPARILIALVAAGSMAVISFLPESHAEHEQAAPAALPSRRPPPEVEIEVRAVQPDEERAEAEAVAARDLATGRLEQAIERYRELQEAAPDDPVFRDFTTVIQRRVKSRCPEGDCVEGLR